MNAAPVRLSATERDLLARRYLHGTDARGACATHRALARKGLLGAGGLTPEGRAIGRAAAEEQLYRVTLPNGARVEWLDAAMMLRRGVVVGRVGSTLTVERDGGERSEVPAGDALPV